MIPATRTQVDGKQDEISLRSAINTHDLPDETRQEHKRETDINHVLAQYQVGAVPPQLRTPSYGEVDYDMDLQSGFIAVEAAQLAWRNLPPELREKYKNERGMLDAANRGEFGKDMKELRAKQEEAEEDAREATRRERAARRAQADAEKEALEAVRRPKTAEGGSTPTRKPEAP